MAKKTALQLTNELMRRIYQADVSDLSTDTGHGQIALGYINDAIDEIYNKAEGKWYTLLANRTYKTSLNVSITVVDYSTISTGTITITYNGVSVVLTEGTEYTAVTSNEITAGLIATAINDHSSLDGITATAEGTIVTAVVTPSVNYDGLTAIATSVASTILSVTTAGNGSYTLATDYGSSYLMKDLTNGRIIPPEWDKVIDFDDPDEDSTGSPLVFSVRDDVVRLYPKPSSVLKIKEIYWKLPAKLSANADLYTLPEFCQAAILKVAEGELFYYQDKSTKGDRARGRAKILMEDAIATNENILDSIISLDANAMFQSTLTPPSLGSNYANPYGY